MVKNSKLYRFLTLAVENSNIDGLFKRSDILQALKALNTRDDESKWIYDDGIYASLKKGYVEKIRPGIYKITELGLQELEASENGKYIMGVDW